MRRKNKRSLGILPHQRIFAFNTSGKRTKFRTDRKLILKVYDTKKRKYVRSFNKKSNGRDVPKLFGRTQFAMQHLYRESVYQKPSRGGVSFRIDSSKFIKNQIPTRIVNHIRNNTVRNKRAFQINITFTDQNGDLKRYTSNPAHLLTRKVTNDDIRKIITNEAVSLAVDRGKRFSDIIHAHKSRQKREQLTNNVKIKITYINAPKAERKNRVKKSNVNKKSKRRNRKTRGNKTR